jgi:hypothetical protein
VSAAGWLNRIRGFALGSASEQPPLAPAPVIRAGPGLTALFESLDDDRSHAVLDLGAAGDKSLATYSRLARQVRFADLSSRPAAELDWAAALDQAASTAVEPFDVLLLWDTLGRLSAEERPRMVARLAQLAAPDARLHMVLEAPERTGPRPLRFSLADAGHMRHEVTWDDPAPPSRLLPANVERMLAPFQVVHAFTLKGGLREYLAVRRPPASLVMAATVREQRPAARRNPGNPPGPNGVKSASSHASASGTAFAKGPNKTPTPREKI